MNPLVSVCIPAYKNTTFLERLLASLLMQSFSQFEVIISDDSPDESVAHFIKDYEGRLQMRYFKNNPALGTPANWNFAMKQAKGKYIKLIHDDDWLATVDSLERMVASLEDHPKADFVFCAYHNVDVDSKQKHTVVANAEALTLIEQNPLHLYSANIIGPPSVIMHRATLSFDYDEQLKWVVDFEAYMRCLQAKHAFVFIDKPLINVGISKLQVTKTSSRVREVEIPENLYMLEKQGLGILNQIWVFDYYWRLLRNVQIRKEVDIVEAGWATDIPQPLLRMLKWQQKVPLSWLKKGGFSKSLMSVCFISRGKL